MVPLKPGKNVIYFRLDSPALTVSESINPADPVTMIVRI